MSHSSSTPATLYSYHDVCVCGSTGECQWVSKQFSDCSKEMVDNMTRDEGYKTCSTIFPGLKVTDVVDLVRVHGYGVTDLTPLKALTRAQGQALMEKIKLKMTGKRSADQVGNCLYALNVCLL